MLLTLLFRSFQFNINLRSLVIILNIIVIIFPSLKLKYTIGTEIRQSLDIDNRRRRCEGYIYNTATWTQQHLHWI